jgi:hypothetical protein
MRVKRQMAQSQSRAERADPKFEPAPEGGGVLQENRGRVRIHAREEADGTVAIGR